jgi:LmbE family N-acetylglucosaminyl deacetylase
MSFPNFTGASRLLLIAPHPDDESLACSVVLQRAVRAGLEVRVVYATDGENNPWPQRFLDKKWRLNANDRTRWGKIRRAEALAALDALQVPIDSARFLGLPDQELTNLLLSGGRTILDRLIGMIQEWEPTHLLVPSVFDTHPDHNALAVISRFVLNELLEQGNRISAWSYVVHGHSAGFFVPALTVRCSQAEALIKLNAIRCHKTQLSLSKKRFLAYAARPEHFCRLQSSDAGAVDGSIAGISRQRGFLRIEFEFSSRALRAKQPAFLICGYDEQEDLLGVTVKVPPRSSMIELFDCRAMSGLGFGQYRGNRFEGELTVPIDAFCSTGPLFIKIERRRWFFDEAGWIGIPPCGRQKAERDHRASEQSLAIR